MAGRWFTPKQKEIIWHRDNGVCQLCGRRARFKNWEADHVIPFCEDGPTTVENGQVSHPWCNREKNRLILVGSWTGSL